MPKQIQLRSWVKGRYGFITKRVSVYGVPSLVVIAGWLLIAITWSTSMHLASEMVGSASHSWLQDFAYLLEGIVPWVLATPLILWLGDRYSISRPHLVRNLVLQLLAAVFLIALLETAGLLLNHIDYFIQKVKIPPHFFNLLAINSLFAIPTYGAVIGIGHAIAWFRRYRIQERRLAQIQLTALRTQLNPHFLFNTLNAVTAAGYRDPALSDRILTRLAELLRASLACDQQMVPLSEEIAFLKAYIEIHQLLVTYRLGFEVHVQPGIWHADVPPMLLQPLVENAIIHGAVASGGCGATVKLVAQRSQDRLRVTIENEVRPEACTPPIGENRLPRGNGLRITRDRLQVLYGNAHSFTLYCINGHRAVANIEIPFREAAGLS
ncbi:MAG: histidine kinase [Proteobacteria bacterium]|nr:histidine kinase [Pseudomonadota bacterium]